MLLFHTFKDLFPEYKNMTESELRECLRQICINPKGDFIPSLNGRTWDNDQHLRMNIIGGYLRNIDEQKRIDKHRI